MNIQQPHDDDDHTTSEISGLLGSRVSKLWRRKLVERIRRVKMKCSLNCMEKVLGELFPTTFAQKESGHG